MSAPCLSARSQTRRFPRMFRPVYTGGDRATGKEGRVPSIACRLMPEMARAGECHRHSAFVGCGDHISVFNRTAGLDGGGCSGFRGCDESIGKREKGIAANGTA